MKIAQVVCIYPPLKGGIGNTALSFSSLLQKKGYTVHTFTPKYKKRISKNIKTNNVFFLHPWLQYGNGAFIPQLLWKLKKYDTVILHYPFFGGMEIIWLFKLIFSSKKLIIHYHMDIKGLSLPAKILTIPSCLIFNSLFKKADVVTCASSDYIKESKLKKFYSKNKNKFKVIPFGVDTDRFKPKKEKNSSEINILFVGGLDKAHYFKGVDNLIKAVAGLKSKERQPNWKLNIVGEGELRESYINLAKKLKVETKINFWGNVKNKDLAHIYKNSDLFVLPSINKGEAFGLVLLEAMASGLPVIASDLPGVRKVFKNGKQGLLVKPNNILDLENKLQELLSNKNTRQKMGQAARRLTEQKYSLEKVAKKLDKILSNQI